MYGSWRITSEIPMRNHTPLIIVSALTALSLVSCMAATPVVIQQIPSGVSPTASLPPKKPALTRTAQATPTRPAPSTPSAMPATVTPPTGTPPPPLTPVEGAKLVKELLLTNGNCELPCWWGIYPGEALTPANLELALRTPYHRMTDGFIDFAVDYIGADTLASFDYQVSVVVVLTTGVVSEIKVSSETATAKPSATFAKDWQALALHRMLTKFGQPTEVRLAYNEVAPNRYAPLLFSLDVIYADQGIAIHYTGDLQRRAGRYIVCPSLSNVRSISLFLSASGDEARFKDQLRNWSRYNVDYSSPIQDVTAMSVADFYTTLRDMPNACFRPTGN